MHGDAIVLHADILDDVTEGLLVQQPSAPVTTESGRKKNQASEETNRQNVEIITKDDTEIKSEELELYDEPIRFIRDFFQNLTRYIQEGYHINPALVTRLSQLIIIILPILGHILGRNHITVLNVIRLSQRGMILKDI